MCNPTTEYGILSFMKYIFIILFGLLTSVSTVSANTFTIETQAGDEVTTSTVTVDAPSNSAKSLTERINDLFIAMGGDNTLYILSNQVDAIAVEVVSIIDTEPVDFIALQKVAEDLSYLALQVRVYLLQQQVADLQNIYTTNNSKIFDIVFGE